MAQGGWRSLQAQSGPLASRLRHLTCVRLRSQFVVNPPQPMASFGAGNVEAARAVLVPDA
jgi:hypothetical protein